MRLSIRLVTCALILAGCGSAAKKPSPAPGDDDASTQPPTDGGASKPHCARFSPEREAFFGDLHVHTALSLDANLQGTRLRPVEAYRFARGERVGLPPYDDSGKPARTLQLERPLDFVALSDHAEFLGFVNTCQTEGADGYDSDECKSYRESPDAAFYAFNARVAAAQGMASYGPPCTADNNYCNAAAMAAWNEVKSAAKAQNDTSDQCQFSTFVAYEWSASPGLLNLHRNVIFGSDQVPALPFSYLDGNQEQELWSALEKDCLTKDGCDVLTIPHNSNLSSGLMFEPLDANGKPIDSAYAKKRAAFEPLVEIIQHKGASECMPEMGNDEECSFELMPYASLLGAQTGSAPETLVPADFVRHALGQGLLLEKSLGANPFAYGFVGGTDTHLALPGGVDEWNFEGHGGAGSNARTELPKGLPEHHWLNPGGLSVLWAEENSREALFRAMKRREAYATSGTRIVLRMFGGYDLASDACQKPDFVQQGYAQGVPMGSDLPAAPNGKAPRFMVWAMRDAGTAKHPGTPLEKLQIIKGWVTNGKVQYRVYDVADSGHPGASVAADCTPQGQGADELCSVWQDPGFSPGESAFYYARVLENPTCRWQAYRCRAAKVDCTKPDAVPEGYEGCCGGEPETQRERAWSSPIFYAGP